MRVLISNISILHLTGTVIVVRDLFLGLRARGHQPIVYSPRLGTAARVLANAGIEIVGDLDDQTRPDIIHGHHNIPTIMALSKFVDVPAIWINHGRNGWFDSPPLFDRIFRYLAVDTIRRDLLIQRYGIPALRVGILQNAVDLTRFTPRQFPLPTTPRNLLLFAKDARIAPMVSSVAQRFGLAFDAIGAGVNRPTSTPESFLSAADIVVATGRAAIEALCAGASVIVGDARGMAGMATTHNYDALRDVNFGATSLVHEMNEDALETEIARYDHVDAAAVSARTREDVDLDKTLDRLERLYGQAISTHQGEGWTSRDSSFVRSTLDHWPAGSLPSWQGVREQLAALAKRNDDTYLSQTRAPSPNPKGTAI